MDVFHPNWSKRHQTDFQRLFELSPAAHLVVNADLKVVAVSDKYLRITENRREDLVDRSLDRDFSRHPYQPWVGNVRRLVQSFQSVQQSGKRQVFVIREKMRNQDTLSESSRRTWRGKNTPIFDRHGKLSLILHQLKRVSDPAASQHVRKFARRLISAQEKDRTRISRDLHDQMAQYLSAITLELESLKSNSDQQKIQSGVEHIQQLIENVGDDVHRLTWDLRPAPIEEVGFRNSLVTCVDEVSAHSSIEILFHSNLMEPDRFDPTVETICYRFIQEALANIVKHADAKTASVIVTRHPHELEIIVEDDGNGFDVAGFQQPGANRSHFGLQGMAERVKLIGGHLHIESGLQRGTSLFARLPISKVRQS